MKNRKNDLRQFLKSQVCFAESLFEMLIQDIASGRPPCVRKSLMRDFLTIKTRLNSEGISFCTTVLPSLSKAIHQSFRSGRLTIPLGFARMKGTTLPCFLSGLLKDVYNEDGFLLANPCTASVSEALQVCGVGYKLNLPFSREQVDQSIDSYKCIETELSYITEYDVKDLPVVKLARTMISRLFPGELPINNPRHGPGRVATGEFGNEKWNFSRRYAKLHEKFPYYDWFFVSRKHFLDRVGRYKTFERHDHGISSMRLVPKDSRGPRIISMEPLEYQYIQQAVCQAMVNRLEKHPFTRRHVNFSDQKVNRDLAMIGSYFDTWATLDMKDASDRVHIPLVRTLFKDTPFLDILEACRSEETRLPDGSVVRLHKFSPMGSAVCFPLESVIFYTLAVSAIMMENRISMKKAMKFVFVYGDDLIIHRPYAELVMEHIESVGLKFNRDKCFIHGPFRESCGFDAFKGTNVAPIRWRKPWAQHLDAVTVDSFSEFASLLYVAGYIRAANLVWRMLEKQIGALPTVSLAVHVPYIAKVSRLRGLHTPNQKRYDDLCHHLQHNAVILKQKLQDDAIGDWEGTFRSVLTGMDRSKTKVKDASKRADSSYITRRWMRLI